MYREYRDTTVASAVTKCYRDMGARHRARAHSIQVCLFVTKLGIYVFNINFTHLTKYFEHFTNFNYFSVQSIKIIFFSYATHGAS